MAEHSHIEWTDATWNPITGCSVTSPGCTNCYAMRLAGTRLQHHPSRAGLTADSRAGPVWTGKVRLNEQWLDQPIHWRTPRRIRVCDDSDLFHESVPDDWIDRIFAVMASAPRHTFQVPTKRAERMRRYLSAFRPSPATDGFVTCAGKPSSDLSLGEPLFSPARWPLPNVWLGVSAEDQRYANERIPHLLNTPAALRFLSAEPLLGHLDIRAYWGRPGGTILDSAGSQEDFVEATPGLDWIIAGGESGPGARPMHPDWARSLRDQCQTAGVPFFLKQWGNWLHMPDRAHFRELARDPWQRVESRLPGVRPALMFNVGKKAAGALLDGREWREMPR